MILDPLALRRLGAPNGVESTEVAFIAGGSFELLRCDPTGHEAPAHRTGVGQGRRSERQIETRVPDIAVLVLRVAARPIVNTTLALRWARGASGPVVHRLLAFLGVVRLLEDLAGPGETRDGQ